MRVVKVVGGEEVIARSQKKKLLYLKENNKCRDDDKGYCDIRKDEIIWESRR